MPATEVRKYKIADVEDLSTGVSRLSEEDLNVFFVKLQQKIIGKKILTPQEEEIRLIKQIKEKIPISVIRHFKKLQKKLNEEIINDKEYAEMIQLSDFIESKNVERVKLLIELSKIRKTPIDELAIEIGFKNLHA